MDKEPSLGEIWMTTALFIVFAVLLAERKTWLPLAIWPFSLLFGAELLLELNSPYVGPAILREAGWAYVAQAVAASVLCIVGPVATIAWAAWKASKLPQLGDPGRTR